MANATDAIVVFITAPTADEATRLADALVEARLAACVQILPEMQSVYRWQGQVERQKEILMIVKTVASKFESLETTVRKIHSYETPEIVAFPLTTGSSSYLKWINETVGADSGSR
jgi:periplasmic divalent cation tolerance protein